MKIITGSTGTTHVTSNNDGEFNQAIFGNDLVVFKNGESLNATIVDNNTIRVSDGDLVLQGRHALIEPNTTEDVVIETGAVGVNRNDLIVARYVLDTATGYEDITLEVLKGTETSGAAVDPEITTGDIRTGSKLVEAALYRVKIEGINIVALEKLFTVTDNLIDMIIDLQKKNSELNSKLPKVLWENPNPNNAFAEQTITLSSDDYDYLIVEWKHTNTGYNYPCCIVNKGGRIHLNAPVFAHNQETGTKMRHLMRVADYIDDTHYNVGVGFLVYDNTRTDNNANCIPTKIYGGKY